MDGKEKCHEKDVCSEKHENARKKELTNNMLKRGIPDVIQNKRAVFCGCGGRGRRAQSC